MVLAAELYPKRWRIWRGFAASAMDDLHYEFREFPVD